MGGVSPRTVNRLLLLLTALLFSTGGAAIKATQLTSWQVASFRSAVAAAAVILLLPEARRGWDRRVPLVACAYAATLLCFVLANKATTAANAIYLQSAAPIYVLALSPWLLRERVHRRDALFGAVVACGLVLFFVGHEAPASTAPHPLRGNVLAVLSGIAWAFTITGLRWLGRESNFGATATVVAGNLIAAIVALPMALPVTRAGWNDVLVILYLGIFQIGLAYFCMTRALRHVPAFEAATLLMLEPALNPVWAWLVHNERPGLLALAGGALILSASLANTWVQSRREPVPGPRAMARSAD
ncbi:MAG TPA: DMT family transporter [Bryobacteraceae bacterium]|nr:DMT family transporter [Bryobacteraceae bacterium]HOQ44683.1 DMT family transporter [Bryobacteraceae bacterium]HPQ16538.1 DMT family transporter [Bryobacteraceae bacterium]HPU71893.1 DMT family transporter [Bryobacteraceae bacterium]